jgi:hypothetical protein
MSEIGPVDPNKPVYPAHERPKKSDGSSRDQKHKQEQKKEPEDVGAITEKSPELISLLQQLAEYNKIFEKDPENAINNYLRNQVLLEIEELKNNSK